jgi:hypothetical protein
MWSMLDDISSQVVWHGYKLTSDEWKDVFTASLKKQKVVAGIDGGFVVCGQSTSKMTPEELTDLITIMEMFAANNDVHFKDMT